MSAPVAAKRLIAVWRIACGMTVLGSIPAILTQRANALFIDVMYPLFDLLLGNIHPSGSTAIERSLSRMDTTPRVSGCLRQLPPFTRTFSLRRTASKCSILAPRISPCRSPVAKPILMNSQTNALSSRNAAFNSRISSSVLIT